MPTTDELFQRLATDATPIRRGAALRRLAWGIVLGSALSSIAALAGFGLPLQAVRYTGAAPFAMKLLFSAALLAISSLLLLSAGRPGHDPARRLPWLLAPPSLVALSATIEMSLAVPETREQLWLGSTWTICLPAIILLSVPVFLGIIWAFQRLAPTRLRLAGLLAGLTAGSAAATLYSIYCPETTATFLISWYSLGVLGAGLVGLLAGPRLLKW